MIGASPISRLITAPPPGRRRRLARPDPADPVIGEAHPIGDPPAQTGEEGAVLGIPCGRDRLARSFEVIDHFPQLRGERCVLDAHHQLDIDSERTLVEVGTAEIAHIVDHQQLHVQLAGLKFEDPHPRAQQLPVEQPRHVDGRGDIGRMERQQQFVSAIIRKATSSGTLLNPIKLANFYQATISTVKMDEGVNKNDLLTLAKQMRNLSSGNVRTLTVPLSDPNGRYPGLGSVVIWDSTLAPELWSRIKNDTALVDTVISKKSSASPKATPSASTIDKFKTHTAAENPCGAKK